MKLLAPRVCHPPARSGQRRGRERRHRDHRTGVDDRAAREKARLDSNTGPGRKQSACAKKAPPIPLVTDATADLPAPIFLIAASPIVIRQGYFKRLRLIYLFPYQLRPCILNHSSNIWPKCSLIHSWQTVKTGAQAYLYYTDLWSTLDTDLSLHFTGSSRPPPPPPQRERKPLSFVPPCSPPHQLSRSSRGGPCQPATSTKPHTTPPPLLPPSAVLACHQPGQNGFGPFLLRHYHCTLLVVFDVQHPAVQYRDPASRYHCPGSEANGPPTSSHAPTVPQTPRTD